MDEGLFDGCVCIFSVGTCCWFLTCAQHDRKVYDLPFLARCKGSGSSEGDATDGSQITGAEQFTGNRGFAHIPSNTFLHKYNSVNLLKTFKNFVFRNSILNYTTELFIIILVL
jgi:hypothetical protein